MLHLDRALARIREYERIKLESEFNPRSASPAGVCDLSNAAHPSANSADKTEGTIIYEAACRQLPPQPENASFLRFVIIYCLLQKARRLMCAALRLIPSSWTVRLKPS